MDPYTSQLDTKTSRLAKSGSPGLVNVSCGHNHTACVTQSGSVYVCGHNEKGCLGLSLSTASNSTKTTIHKPTRLELSQPILQVSCGLHHTAAVTTNGTVLSWGDNQQGQLGHRVNNKSSSSFCPPQAMMLSSSSSSNQTTPVAAAVACGHYFTLVLTNRMCVFACGADYIAPHGSPIPVTIPTLIGLPLVFIAKGMGIMLSLPKVLQLQDTALCEEDSSHSLVVFLTEKNCLQPLLLLETLMQNVKVTATIVKWHSPTISTNW